MSGRDDDLMKGRANSSGVPFARDPEAIGTAEVRARQRSRARVMAVLLGAFVILIFAISIVKIAAGYGP
jgi:hypothetical protein